MSEHREQRKPKTVSLGEVTGAAVFVVALISAWLYTIGWTYAYHYFDHFRIPLLMVEIPKENYFVYGGVVVQHFRFWALGIGITSVAAWALWRWLRIDSGLLKLPLSALAVFATFWIGREAAVLAADDQYLLQRNSSYRAFSRVEVRRKESTSSSSIPPNAPKESTTLKDLNDGCYRLLLHNQNRLFLIRPIRDDPTADLPLLVLPWEQIELIRVLPDYPSCQ
jgi:hypothetical protein